MIMSFSDIRTLAFESLSQIKANLSSYLRQLSPRHRLVITNNGKPVAVVMAYDDYLALLPKEEEIKERQPRVIDFEQWKKSAPQRQQIRKSIEELFNVKDLSRKGQKAYKYNTVKGWERGSRET